ncbi:hypothetical protein ACLMJK_009493 [Lecanora helva]
MSLPESAPVPEMSEQKKPIGFLDLPPEIRNQILEYVLVPGEVHVRPLLRPQQEQEDPDSVAKRLLEDPLHPLNTLYSALTLKREKQISKAGTHPGFQVLAACKQTLSEGRSMCYEGNTFYLPPGPLERTCEWLGGIQPGHRAMIKNVCIELSLADLTPEMLAKLETHILRDRRRNLLWIDIITKLTTQVLKTIWFKKIDFVGEWELLDKIHVRFMDQKRTFSADEKDLTRKMRRAVIKWKERIEGELAGVIDMNGWFALQEWMRSCRVEMEVD